MLLHTDHPRICMECRCHYCREGCTQYIETRDSAYTAYGMYVLAFACRIGLIEPTKELAEYYQYCTTCGLCKYRCTVSLLGTFYRKILDIPRHVSEIRAYFIERGLAPTQAARLLENLRKYNNPQGVSRPLISDINSGSNSPNSKVKDALQEKTEILFYMGDSAYDQRNSKALESAINILKNAGVNFGILKNEPNSGDLALRLGELGLFEMFKEKNLEILERFDRVITFSPHDFHTFKNDYGLDNIIHISVFLKELIDDGKIKLRRINERVIYKDPCYLGRHNGIFDEPRDVVSSVMELEEFYANRYMAICCGGGSGHAWMDLEKRDRVSKLLAKEVGEKGVDTVITACPICTTMLEGENLKTLNIVEVVEKGMEV